MSSVSTKPNKATTLARLQALIAGTRKHSQASTYSLGGVTYTAATLTQEFESLANAITALNEAQVRAKDAVKAQKAMQAKVGPLMRDYKRLLQVTLGTAGTELADYGLQPLKGRKPLDSNQRVAARAKSTATREARGTTSKKQKLAVKGDVTAVHITPVKVAPVAAPSAAPAVPPASNANAR
jgi:hypothetical protein